MDIECAGPHLVCVGVCDISDESYVCIRFRGEGGSIWDPDGLWDRAASLAEFLESPSKPLIFHNGQAFDIPYLEEVGFKVEGYVDDTLLRAHLTYAEHKKNLEFLAQTYTGMPGWKTMIKEQDEEEGK